MTLTYWNGTILGPYGVIKIIIQTTFENRIYSLAINCGNDYPNKAPDFKFNTKVNLPFVNQANGKIENFSFLKNWKSEYTIDRILLELKKEMVNNKKLAQPAEGLEY